jgi:hypothetical protein
LATSAQAAMVALKKERLRCLAIRSRYIAVSLLRKPGIISESMNCLWIIDNLTFFPGNDNAGELSNGKAVATGTGI